MPTVGVFAVIVDAHGRVLCIQRNYGDHGWGLPGGRMEPRESPLATLAREVHEETGYIVSPGTLLGVYSVPWKDDLVVCFTATILGRDPWEAGAEIAAVGFFAREDLPEPFGPRARRRIDDMVAGRSGVVHVFEAEDADKR